jgi:hypothetical protein
MIHASSHRQAKLGQPPIPAANQGRMTLIDRQAPDLRKTTQGGVYTVDVTA